MVLLGIVAVSALTLGSITLVRLHRTLQTIADLLRPDHQPDTPSRAHRVVAIDKLKVASNQSDRDQSAA